MYDLAIIGGGPGGYTAAERAGAAGLSVVLFERNELGGVCLNEGCIPTKTLLYSAKVFDYAKHADLYGVSVEGASFDYSKILKRKTKVVRKLVGGVKLKMKNAGVTVVGGEAVIAGPVAGGFVVLCDGTEYAAGKLLVCTGSEAVVGSKVTVIEMMPKILGPMDSEISELLQKQYAKKGVEFRLGCKVTGIEGDTVVYEDPEGNVCRVHGDKILVSVGRRARLEGYGLETLGVSLALTPAGRPYGIKVDDRMRTDVPDVYAAGDVTGFSLLAHTAVREAEVVVNDILGRDDKMSYKAIPGVVYTNPEVAGVGLTEDEAARKGIDVTVLKLPMAYSGRFVAENERGEGLCKILVCPSSHEVLGVHMLGNPSSEMIHSACIAIEQGMTVERLKEVVFPHPTVSEIIKETVFTL